MPAAEPPDDRSEPASEPFAARVLAVVQRIPEGHVLSYGAVAVMAGHPRAARAVGSVLSAHGGGVPWWRVVRGTGAIPRRPTARLQRSLLVSEGVVFRSDRVDLDRFAWIPPMGTFPADRGPGPSDPAEGAT